jgi:replicative DNA helicase
MTDHEHIFAGQILRDASLLHETALEPRHFADHTARRVYAAARSVINAGYEVDTFTVRDADEHLTASTVTDLLNSAPTTANWRYYEAEIFKSHRKREVRRVGQELAEADDADAAIAKAESDLAELQRVGDTDRVRHRSETIHETVEDIEAAYHRGGALPGIPTGYSRLDDLLQGWQKRTLYIIGARPSQGKSGLGLNLYDHAAMRQGVTTGFISLESAAQEMNKRSLANHANIEGQKLSTGFLKRADFDALTSAAGKIYESPSYIYDVPNQRLDRVVSVCRQMVRQYGVQLIFIDYLQLIRVPGAENMIEQVQTASTTLKSVSRMLEVPIVALAQLGRQVDSKGQEKRPGIGDLQHSSRIEQDADSVILLHPTGEAGSYTRTVEAIVAKNRDGALGTVRLVFAAPFVRFTQEDNSYEAPA